MVIHGLHESSEKTRGSKGLREGMTMKLTISYFYQIRNFKELYSDMKRLATAFKEKQQLKEDEEPILVLIVYEAPSNKCSERQSLINYFNSKGISCEELKYPIEENY